MEHELLYDLAARLTERPEDATEDEVIRLAEYVLENVGTDSDE